VFAPLRLLHVGLDGGEAEWGGPVHQLVEFAHRRGALPEPVLELPEILCLFNNLLNKILKFFLNSQFYHKNIILSHFYFAYT
jgi:hypothetical protein